MSREHWSAVRARIIAERRRVQWAEFCEEFTWREFNDLLDSGIDPAEQLAAKREDERNGIDPYGDY